MKLRRKPDDTPTPAASTAALQHERTMTLINNLSEAIMSTDEHGHITVYNAAMLNLLDTNTAIENQPIDTVLPVSDTTGSRISLI